MNKCFILVFLVFGCCTLSAQTQIRQDSAGNYIQEKVVFTTEESVVNYYKLERTNAWYTNIKGEKYRVYTKNGKSYFIAKTKTGTFTRRSLKLS